MRIIVSLAVCLLAITAQRAACAASPGGPIEVRIEKTAEGYQLLRGGKPYVIRGAGISGGDMAELARLGGNSIRTWSTEEPGRPGRQLLDEAHALGLTVSLCIHLERERDEFDYNDEKAVAAQFARARREVLAYKDHPALLTWLIGNEMNFDYTNPRVFDAVNDIARMIHEVDGLHPVTTPLAGYDPHLARVVAERAPDLDFISLQLYGNLVDLPQMLEAEIPQKPYMITEWGAVGFWEAGKTAWQAPIENHSSAKADYYRVGYETLIRPAAGRIIGDYVFLWGQKQERTPTWFGMFLQGGERTETVDVMHRLWTGREPANRSPRLESLQLEGMHAGQNIVVSPGQRLRAELLARDPDGDPLQYRWEVKPESDSKEVGGDPEAPIPSLPGLVEAPHAARVALLTPAKAGAYRLYAYAFDGKGNAGHANIPFLVKP